jgi:hypothetical protein
VAALSPTFALSQLLGNLLPPSQLFQPVKPPAAACVLASLAANAHWPHYQQIQRVTRAPPRRRIFPAAIPHNFAQVSQNL